MGGWENADNCTPQMFDRSVDFISGIIKQKFNKNMRL